MFVSGGVIGGTLYLVLVVLISVTAVRYWMKTRSLIALAIVGFLVFMALGWLRPGQYCLTPLTWLVIGSLDRLYHRRSDS